MTGQSLTPGYNSKGTDPEVAHVWNIIESCKTLEQTSVANKCVDALLQSRKNVIPHEIIKEMREYIFNISYDMYVDFINDK